MDKHSAPEIEQALLGVIIIDSSAIDDVRGYLLAKDFYLPKNALIFESILEMVDEGISIENVSLVNHLKEKGAFAKIGGQEYLATVIKNAGLKINLPSYVKKIADKSQIRSTYTSFKSIEKEFQKQSISAEKLLDKVENEILLNTRNVKTKEFVKSKLVVDEVISEIEKRASGSGMSGIPSDFPSLDALTFGFQKGDFVIVAARPSMGKTAFALNIVSSVSAAKNVALFSIEMPRVQIMSRIISLKGFIDGNKIKDPSKLTDSDWNKLQIAGEKARELNLFIDDTAGIKLAELIWKARKLHKNVGLDLIVIDYLQLINVGSGSVDNRQGEVSKISRTLKQLARELNLPVIALSQLSRRVEQRESKIPMMSDIRESGAIEQDADLIMFLYREAYYNKEAEEPGSNQAIDVFIAKHRNGPTGQIQLAFNPKISLFSDVPKVGK